MKRILRLIYKRASVRTQSNNKYNRNLKIMKQKSLIVKSKALILRFLILVILKTLQKLINLALYLATMKLMKVSKLNLLMCQ